MGMFPLSMGKSLHYTCETHTFDFDYDGQKEIWVTGNTDESTEGTVVALRPDGTEPYDLDGNATSYSGYAKIPWNAEATPVVADLLGNGEQCIIVPQGMTREKITSSVILRWTKTGTNCRTSCGNPYR